MRSRDFPLALAFSRLEETEKTATQVRCICSVASITTVHNLTATRILEPAWSGLAKQVHIFVGSKIENVCQQVLKPLGSYMRVLLYRLQSTLVIADTLVDCEQSLSWKIHREQHKTGKRASVTVSVTCERRLVARASRLQSHSHAWLFCVLPHGFSRKRETARSLRPSGSSYSVRNSKTTFIFVVKCDSSF